MRQNKELFEFENKINEYFQNCEDKNTYPDEAGLILHLGLTKTKYENYINNKNGKFSAYAKCLDDAKLRRESIIVRGIFSTDTKSTTGKVFLARQPSNGGLSDKPIQEKSNQIEIIIGGEANDYFN